MIATKRRAFWANREAKRHGGDVKAKYYGIKDHAINTLLSAGFAFAEVSDRDWYLEDPLISVSFVGGGELHTKLSKLSLSAARVVRHQLHGEDWQTLGEAA